MNAEQRAFYEYGKAWGVAKTTKKAQAEMMVKSGTTLETGLYMYKCRFSHLIRDAWHKRAVAAERVGSARICISGQTQRRAIIMTFARTERRTLE